MLQALQNLKRFNSEALDSFEIISSPEKARLSVINDGTEKVEDYDEFGRDNSLTHLKLQSQSTDAKNFTPEKSVSEMSPSSSEEPKT